MEGIVYVLLGILAKVCKSQYIAINPTPFKLSTCDSTSSIAHIERFFNLIFTEFHNAPPACMCIQMCPRQPTYCYPNGCLKILDKRKSDEAKYEEKLVPKVKSEGEIRPAVYGADLRDMLERPGLLAPFEETSRKPKINDMLHHHNPFNELILRYKKVPKLEMKYNLREQVRATKTDKLNKEKNIDISKTRWPSNKHLLHGKSPFKRMHHYKKNNDAKPIRFFVSMLPESEPSKYSPVFYKKYLTKRDNTKGVNVEALYLYQTNTDNFTVEALVNNLIESGLQQNKQDANLDLYKGMNDAVKQELKTETNANLTKIHFSQDINNDAYSIVNKTRASTISMSSIYKNTNVTKHVHVTKVDMKDQNTFLEMIANMSNQIDIQNKVGMALMQMATGLKNISGTATVDKSTNNSVTKTDISDTKRAVEITNATNLYIHNITSASNHFATTIRPVPVKNNSAYKKLSRKSSVNSNIKLNL